MKYAIISFLLAFFLVGCDQKPKLSINETDTLETYANNPAFTKLERHYDPATDKDDKNTIVYAFIGTPISVNNIEVNDLNVLGGLIYYMDKPEMKHIYLHMKGKQHFNTLVDRISKLKNFTCQKIDMGDHKQLLCRAKNRTINPTIHITYNHITDGLGFAYTKYIDYGSPDF